MNPATAIQNAAEHFIRRACRRLPAEIGDECHREWTAETWAILSDSTARPAARRYLAALRYAAGHIRGTRRHPQRLRGAASLRQRLEAFAGATVMACGYTLAVTSLALWIPGVRSATGGFGDALASIIPIASVFFGPLLVLLVLSTRRRWDSDREPGQEP